MKKALFRIITGFSVLICSFAQIPTANAQSQVEKGIWHIGGEGLDAGNDICPTTDGGCIITGYTFSYVQSAGYCDLYAVKLNASGNVAWTRTVGGTNLDFGHSVRQTPDGGYIICGRSISYTNGYNFNVYLVKLSASGVVEWTKAIGPTSGGMAFGNDICLTNDGGYAFAGRYNGDVYVGKVNAQGDVLWIKGIGNREIDGINFIEYGEAIDQAADGGLTIVGSTNSYGAGGYDVYVVKLSASGNLEWTKTIGSAGNDFGKAVHHTSDGGYIVAGYSEGTSKEGHPGDINTYFLKLGSSGELQWTRTYGADKDDYAVSIKPTRDGGYIAAGYTHSFGTDSSSFLAMKLSGNGNLEWTSTIDSQANTTNVNNGRYGICQTADGGYAGVGISYNFNAAGGFDNQVFVVKFDASGNTCVSNESHFYEFTTVSNVVSDSGDIFDLPIHSTQGGVSGIGGDYQAICQVGGNESVSEIANDSSRLSLYPNPAKTKLHLNYSGSVWQKRATVTVYDVYGRSLLQQEIPPYTSFPVSLNIETLSPGTYFIKVETAGKGLFIQKFLKQ